MCEIYTFLIWESARFSAFLSVHRSMQNLLIARVVFSLRFVDRLKFQLFLFNWSHDECLKIHKEFLCTNVLTFPIM